MTSTYMDISYKNLNLIIEAVSDKIVSLTDCEDQIKLIEYQRLLEDLEDIKLKY